MLGPDLQLYLSGDIRLWRMLKKEETGVTPRHSLRIDKDPRMEEVLIKDGTPGFLITSEKNRCYVSFEPKIDGEYPVLTFQIGKNGYKEGCYLYPDTMSDAGEMLINYAGKTFIATPGSRVAHLEVDQDRVKVSSHELPVAPDLRIEDQPPQK